MAELRGFLFDFDPREIPEFVPDQTVDRDPGLLDRLGINVRTISKEEAARLAGDPAVIRLGLADLKPGITGMGAVARLGQAKQVKQRATGTGRCL